MKLVKLAFRAEMAGPMWALVFASGVSVGLVLVRVGLGGNPRHGFLIWNLFLAWVPLLLALLAREEYQAHPLRRWRFGALTGAWLLFFPNAPYIVTDFVHLPSRFYGHYWSDLLLILLYALTGLVLGFLSLYLMHSVIVRMRGRLAGWCFIGLVAGLSGLGVYLGRFLRFNSWDVALKPLALCRGLSDWMLNPFAHRSSLVFAALFATVVFVSYLMLYALTHLRQMQVVPAKP